MSSLENDSMVGRLLEEISWDGKSVKRYRNGGRGLENVLTAEVMLDFLPRDEFLGAVLRKAHGAASTAAFAADEASSAITSLLPGNAQLTSTTIVVQPDAWIETTSCRILVEAKRIRSSAFQQEQLAREYLALMQQAGERRILLLLVLGSSPPIKVKGVARHLEPAESIALHLEPLLSKVEGIDESADELLERLGDRLAWITWSEISEVVKRASKSYAGTHATDATIRRLSVALIRAIEWHS